MYSLINRQPVKCFWPFKSSSGIWYILSSFRWKALLNNDKNSFCFTLKTLFVLKYLNFCPDTFGHVGKRIDEKFSQLIEYSMRNIFLIKSYKISSREIIPRLFSKKTKLSISLDQQSYILYSLLLLYVKVQNYQNILKLRSWLTCFYLIYSFFI